MPDVIPGGKTLTTLLVFIALYLLVGAAMFVLTLDYVTSSVRNGKIAGDVSSEALSMLRSFQSPGRWIGGLLLCAAFWPILLIYDLWDFF